MLAELLSRRVYFEQWRILFTHRVLLAIESATGLDLMRGALDLRRCSAGEVRAVLAALGVAAVIGSAAVLRAAQAALLDGWAASMPEPDGERNEGEMPTWLEAWARAREMGFSDQEWLDATPRMVHARSLERLETTRQREFMQSRAIAMGANFSMCAPKKPFEDDRFMLHPWPKEPQAAMTGDDLMRMMGRYRQKPIAGMPDDPNFRPFRETAIERGKAFA